MITVKMEDITKTFPGIRANDKINFQLDTGEVHALLGENGAGKTTLMNILYGVLKPDSGLISVNGKPVTMKSPKDAIALGIGMVHQHFMLIPIFSVTENIVLGLRSTREPFTDLVAGSRKISKIAEGLGFKIDPEARVEALSIGGRQRVEIVKALFRGASILILDEPTSVLTPQEAEELFTAMRMLTKEGKSVIFITHKLKEVIRISDRVTVLRQGKVVATTETAKVEDEKELARMMVGRDVLFVLPKEHTKRRGQVLEVDRLRVLDAEGKVAVKDVTFKVEAGEIMGIAGVAGNGQKEIAEAITGLRRVESGTILINKENVTNHSPGYIRKLGVAHIPDERDISMVKDFSLMDNIILGDQRSGQFSRSGLLDNREISKYAEKLVKDFGISAPNTAILAGNLSGGNLNRLLLAREISRNPQLIIAAHPTKGIDVAGTEYIRRKLLEEREKGRAILLISEDLDEVLSMSDRVAVLFTGEIMGIVEPGKVQREDVGLMMAGAKRLTGD